MPVIHIPPAEAWRRWVRVAFCFVASGPFDGLAHEPGHGVQLACVVFPGRSGGPGGFNLLLAESIGTTVGLTNVEVWLLSCRSRTREAHG
jgi:hypothetical protein